MIARREGQGRAHASQGQEGPGFSAVPAWVAAAVLIAGALAHSYGTYHPLSLAAVTLATALAVVTLLSRRAAAEAWRSRWTDALLAVGVVGSLAHDALFLPGILVDPARLGAFRPTLGVIALLLATHLWVSPPAVVTRLRFPLVVGGWVVLAGAVLYASPHPTIDVWLYQQGGALALLEGSNPYAFVFRNPYGPETTVIARELLTPDGRGIVALPYPPLTILLDLPAAALGDVRLAYVLATAAGAFLIRALGRGTRTAELAATLLLLQPATFMVMELAWTEPVVLSAVCGAALLASRREPLIARAPGMARPGSSWILLGLVGGVALASKQYTPLLLLPFLILVEPGRRWRVAGVAAAVCAATYLPFLLWDSKALWRSMVTFQLVQPFRPDALSWPAAVVSWGGPQLPPWPAFVAAAGVATVAVLRANSAAWAIAGGAAAWLILVIGNKQAFCNYYWLGAGLLCAAAAAASGAAPAAATSQAGDRS